MEPKWTRMKVKKKAATTNRHSDQSKNGGNTDLVRNRRLNYFFFQQFDLCHLALVETILGTATDGSVWQ